MDRLAQDIRVAVRGFRRNPTFTVTAVLILGLGIGMALAMWTVFNAVLLRRPPVLDPDRIVFPRVLDQAGVDVAMSLEDVDQIRHQSRTMRDIAGVAHGGAYPWPMMDGDHPLPLAGSQVEGRFFEVLGVRPILGRLLRPDDDSTSYVMVLSYGAWQRYFGGDPKVIGRHFRQTMSEKTYAIVGVAPPGIDFPAGTDYWEPVPWHQSQNIVARLAPNVSPEAARSEFLALNRQIAQRQTAFDFRGADIRTFNTAVVGNVRPVLAVALAAVGLLLIIACVNVGNLLLLRAAARSRELAVRRALGATYGDIVRQLVIESCLLALAGGMLGLVCADIARRVLVAVAPRQLPRLDAVSVTNIPVGAAAVVALLSVVLFGVLPALTTPLRVDARSGSATRQRRRVRQLLVAAQVALALILLTGAGLLARSLQRLESIDLGFRTNHLSVIDLTFPGSKFVEGNRLVDLAGQLAPHLAAVPGVISLTPIVIYPLIGPNFWTGPWQIEGQSPDDAKTNPMIPCEGGGPDYFRTFGIPILRGRGFRDTDRETSEQVAVVSQSVARRYWPGQDPIGKRLRMVGDSVSWRRVVGVAGESHFRSLREATPMVYMPYRQYYWQGFIALRTTGTLDAVLPAIRRAIHETDPSVTLWTARTMDDYLAGPLSQPRLSAVLLSGFGIVALLLAAIGLYGIMASAVREQTRDIGVRMALGATPARVRGEVLRRAMAVSLIGAAVGLVGALAASRVVTSLLFQVSPTDPVVLLGACGVLLAVALLAASLPAMHASRVDPARALQLE